MISVLGKFFKFSTEKNRNKFYAALVIGVLIGMCEAAKFPAIGLILQGFLDKNISYEIIKQGLLILVISLIIEIFLRAKSTMLQCEAGYGECADKRIEIARHLRFLPMGYFNDNSLGEITSVATNTMEALGDVATRVVLLTTQGIINTAIITLLILKFDWRIGSIVVVGIILFALVNRQMQMKNQETSEDKIANETELVSRVLEYVQGIPEVKAYRLVGDLRVKLNNAIEKNVQVNTNLEAMANKFIPVQNIILKLTSLGIVTASIKFCIEGTMTPLVSIIMMIMSFNVFHGLETMGSFSSLMRMVDICVSRASDILALPPMDIDGDDFTPKSYEMAVEKIDFAYENKKIIDGVSFNISDKSSVALVGPSGGGKTTLCKLMARFWDVDNGKILLDGKDVKTYSMDSLMKNFSFVFQNVYLFHDTIANNISFGRPDASTEEIVAAAKLAQCHDFISKLPEGYNTIIGEGGASLSGGEKQRISIARAIIKDSPIIILDEATANIDPENELEITEAVKALTKEKTIIMIAHRLKTVRHADRIFVVENGKISQQGTHEELMKEEGIYRRFVDSRNKAIGWKIQ